MELAYDFVILKNITWKSYWCAPVKYYNKSQDEPRGDITIPQKLKSQIDSNTHIYTHEKLMYIRSNLAAIRPRDLLACQPKRTQSTINAHNCITDYGRWDYCKRILIPPLRSVSKEPYKTTTHLCRRGTPYLNVPNASPSGLLPTMAAASLLLLYSNVYILVMLAMSNAYATHS